MDAKSGPKQSQATQRLAQVGEMLGRGMSQRQIAFAMGVSQASVSRMAAKLRAQLPGDEPESGTLLHFLWRVERHRADVGLENLSSHLNTSANHSESANSEPDKRAYAKPPPLRFAYLTQIGIPCLAGSSPLGVLFYGI